MPEPKKDTLKKDPIQLFTTQAQWRAWLEANHATAKGIWLRFYKKDSEGTSINYAQALDEALCFGWIDGLVNKYDAESYIQRFTPRKPKSMWSKRNREHVARLVKENKMTPAGLKAVKEAHDDGRWDAAYDSPATMEVPADFVKELKKNTKAYTFYKTLNKANVYAIAWRLHTAKKPETRAKRFKALLDMLAAEQKLH